ncbi:MAG: hypothetical protein EZS28_010553 [Streblomastix strix]|uniref:Uncharacterized protein n=1 Tax=Streblomastix strix TaxID=222440 RepID=A0A5J4WG74_9EUKA|nr:MAG: hypothetical protein EZS28_010553 [Streblomastix strix]
MTEIIRSSAIERPDGSWQIRTEKWKDGEEGVVIAFRSSQSKFTSPVFWLSQWINADQKRMESGCQWYLIKTRKVATESQISKSVHEVLKLAVNFNLNNQVVSQQILTSQEGTCNCLERFGGDFEKIKNVANFYLEVWNALRVPIGSDVIKIVWMKESFGENHDEQKEKEKEKEKEEQT